MPTYRILSLDGGGIRGIIPVVLLERLLGYQKIKGWLNRVDMLAGTSTGGLIALGIAAGKKLPTIRKLYEQRGEKIFHDTVLDDLFDVGNMLGAEYDAEPLEQEVKRVLGARTKLRNLNKHVLITSFDLDNEAPRKRKRTWKPKLFHNFDIPDGDGDALAYKVGLYTSAAPTYFPTVDGYVDGGVYASNPAMCALAQSQDKRIRGRPALSDVVLLSIGTGQRPQYVEGDELDWGIAKWGKPLVELMLDGMTGIAHFQCKQLLGPRYHRVQVPLPYGEDWPMDAVDRVPEMAKLARGFDLKPTATWLGKNW